MIINVSLLYGRPDIIVHEFNLVSVRFGLVYKMDLNHLMCHSVSVSLLEVVYFDQIYFPIAVSQMNWMDDYEIQLYKLRI